MSYINQDSLTDHTLVSVYRVNGKSFKWVSSDPALTMDLTSTMSKKAFMDAHAGKGGIEIFTDAYQINEQSFFKGIRTVGTGAHILLREGIGASGQLMNALVARTQTGEEGTVNLGKHSRPAGGAKGSLSESNFRELQEEFICAVNTDGSVTVYNIDYDDGLPKDTKEAILDVKRQEISEILQVNGMNGYGTQFETLLAEKLSVPGVTETITQNIEGSVAHLSGRLLNDNPTSGDFAACDIILCAQLPEGMSFSELHIFDGERNQQGELLNRQWKLRPVDEWKRRISEGLPISPAAKPFYNNWDRIGQEVRRLIR
jgi:hypothetical protein